MLEIALFILAIMLGLGAIALALAVIAKLIGLLLEACE